MKWLMVGGVLIAMTAVVQVTSCVRAENAEFWAKINAAEDSWKGAVVVKVCRDGTRIYRLKEGHYNAHKPGHGKAELVENPETVCQP